MNELFIDPGLTGTGWAIWKNNKLYEVGVLESKGWDWKIRGDDIAEKLVGISDCNRIEKIYIEYPSYFDTAGGSMVAKRGDLLKLTWFVGLICGRNYPVPLRLVPVIWKGQLPKRVVIRRIQNILGEKKCNELRIKTHAWDAVGLGLYMKGKMI